jgi:hypothetical protein
VQGAEFSRETAKWFAQRHSTSLTKRFVTSRSINPSARVVLTFKRQGSSAVPTYHPHLNLKHGPQPSVMLAPANPDESLNAYKAKLTAYTARNNSSKSGSRSPRRPTKRCRHAPSTSKTGTATMNNLTKRISGSWPARSGRWKSFGKS